MSRSISLAPLVLPFSVLYIQLNVNPMEKSKVFVNGIKNIEMYFLHSKNGFHKIFINKRYPGLNDWFGWVLYGMRSKRERGEMKTGSILQGIKGALRQKYGGREGYYRLFFLLFASLSCAISIVNKNEKKQTFHFSLLSLKSTFLAENFVWQRNRMEGHTCHP